MGSRNEILILGARSLVAPLLAKRLAEKEYSGRCLSRTPPDERLDFPSAFPWSYLDAKQPGDWAPPEQAVIFSLMPLWLVPPLLPRLAGSRQLIVFSSTSVFSKATSRDPKERAVAEDLAVAEAKIAEFCTTKSIHWTILRPTLIYGGGRDRNVSAIARFIQRWGVFPLVYPAKGLRQPVHAEDLAGAALAAMDNPKAVNESFNLSGGETLSYRAMVERIFERLGRRPRIVPVPLGMLTVGLKVLNRFKRTPYSPELFRRMNQDLAFDADAARAALGYDPRPFRP